MSAKSKQSPNPTSQVLGFQCQVLFTYLHRVFLSKGYTKSLMDYMNICTEKYAAKKTTHMRKTGKLLTVIDTGRPPTTRRKIRLERRGKM